MSYLLKVANVNLSHLHLALPLGIMPFEFCRDLWHKKTCTIVWHLRIFILCYTNVLIIIVCMLDVSIHRLVVERQTDTPLQNIMC